MHASFDFGVRPAAVMACLNLSERWKPVIHVHVHDVVELELEVVLLMVIRPQNQQPRPLPRCVDGAS